MKHPATITAACAIALLAPGAHAAMNGVCASVRTVGGYTLVDLYATFSSAEDRLHGITLQTMNTSAAGGFVQGSSPGLKGWAPDPFFTSTHDSLDSFLTVGETNYGDPTAPMSANLALYTSLFPSGTWNGSPFLPASNSIAVELDCGWFTFVTDTSNGAVDISGLQGRVNVHGSGATSTYGTWFAHLVIAGTGPATVNIGDWNGNYFRSNGSSAEYKPIRLNSSFTVPAPGALALLGGAGLARRRARR